MQGGVHDCSERPDGEGGDVLPNYGEEAPASAGDRAGGRPAVRVPRRQWRRQPPPPGRRLPGPRALWPHFLQPGQHVRPGHPPDRRRHGLLHCWWRLSLNHPLPFSWVLIFPLLFLFLFFYYYLYLYIYILYFILFYFILFIYLLVYYYYYYFF